VETALAVLSLRDQRLPGAVNLREQDPDCLLWLPRETLSGPSLRTILKVSLGFGGHLAAAVLRAVD
jgi:3-oxoacyl-[acyl-carrier-protein] synthase II